MAGRDKRRQVEARPERGKRRRLLRDGLGYDEREDETTG
jgi:hypothetical protein